MPGERSRSTRIVERIVDRYRTFLDRGDGEEEIPFMTEKVERRSAPARIRAMTPPQRRALIDRVGIDEAIRMARED